VDEEFKEISSSLHKGVVQVPLISGATTKQLLVGLNNLTVRRNGWLYVYLSNESNQNVYFDDLIVNHKRGPVVSAQNYYPFGLEIAGLSTKAIGFGGPANGYKYNGKEIQNKEFSDGSGLEWEDYGARMYDPQIGRWYVSDLLAEKYFSETPFNYVLNNPVSFVDYDGMDVYLTTPDGRVVLAKKEEKADILYAVDNKGNIKDTNKDKKTDEKDGVVVKTSGLFEQLSKTRENPTGYIMHSIVSENFSEVEDDLLKVFHYISNNTDVEFSLTYFTFNRKEYITLATMNQVDQSPATYMLGLTHSDVHKKYHTHPGKYKKGERFSMGETDGKEDGGDYGKIVQGKVTYPYYVYFSRTTNLFSITQKGISFIQKINNDYKKLKK
jgi:RHS repeat-associated protein